MADYSVVRQRIYSYGKAISLPELLKQVYERCDEVDDALTLYLAGTDADFNAAIESIFTADELGHLAAMLTNVQLLVSTWQAQHGELLGLNEPE